jgi:hypothetical protein
VQRLGTDGPPTPKSPPKSPSSLLWSRDKSPPVLLDSCACWVFFRAVALLSPAVSDPSRTPRPRVLGLLRAASFDWISLADRGFVRLDFFGWWWGLISGFSRRGAAVLEGTPRRRRSPGSSFPLYFPLLEYVAWMRYGSCDRVASCQGAVFEVVLCLAMRALARWMRAW